MQRLMVVDLGMGNLRSVERALEHVAASSAREFAIERTSDPDRIRKADRIVVPGQGAFRDCAKALSTGLAEALRERVLGGTPLLGICIGLQALFDGSEEAPGAVGLGIFRGHSVRLTSLATDPSTGQSVKIPHMGWNQLEIVRADVGPIRTFLGSPPHMYFVHSYHAVPEDPSLIAAITHHGPHRITAAIQRDNVTATQFHVEKSQEAGLQLLAAFLAA